MCTTSLHLFCLFFCLHNLHPERSKFSTKEFSPPYEACLNQPACMMKQRSRAIGLLRVGDAIHQSSLRPLPSSQARVRLIANLALTFNSNCMQFSRLPIVPQHLSNLSYTWAPRHSSIITRAVSFSTSSRQSLPSKPQPKMSEADKSSSDASMVHGHAAYVAAAAKVISLSPSPTQICFGTLRCGPIFLINLCWPECDVILSHYIYLLSLFLLVP